jgi:hypothetical protein
MSLKNRKPHRSTTSWIQAQHANPEPTAAFPSSEAFDAINEALKASDAERKEAIKSGNAVFAFTLKNKAGETESWHIDLKTKGEAGKGLGEKPGGTLLTVPSIHPSIHPSFSAGVALQYLWLVMHAARCGGGWGLYGCGFNVRGTCG